ncbi:hypothetical protein MYAM1_002089 [Malassezia yamatoensis]|uniref:TRIP4/RQT4 C2HC5-type zinc finger domain-containing protein n=1 Tax=Malassezia yamatoensis TaxID=253288 RepID=A0AAJ5YSG8_9BASI|nr:hypothetical protein MYAM1_002089 [Malassezia yamatoensis]
MEKELGSLLGLDEQTVAEQVVPYLATHQTPQALRLYLRDLVGTSPEANTITEKFVQSRFPEQKTASSSSTLASPRTFESQDNVSTLASSHTKTQSDSPRKSHAKPVKLNPRNVTAALAATEMNTPRNLPPTKEMKELDLAFSMLSVDPSSSDATVFAPSVSRVCLCQGSQHALAEYLRLCISCGLILCAALRPVPVSPYSQCPSCQASPIVSPQIKTQIIAQLVRQREQLALGQQQREIERRAELQNNRYAETPFPTLQGSTADVSTKSTEKKPNRVLHLDMKTHKVTVTRAKNKSAPSASKINHISTHSDQTDGAITTAEDGTQLIHDDQDDGFRKHHLHSQTIHDRHPTESWAALSLHPLHYIEKSDRPPMREPISSEKITAVPDLATLMQKQPPGSSAELQRRNRNAKIASGVARAQKRRSGKSSKGHRDP